MKSINKKHVVILCVIVLLVGLSCTLPLDRDQDIFSKLYSCQTQSDLHDIMGKPDYSSESMFSTTIYRNGKQQKLIAAGEEYYDIGFLGEKGTITVHYDFDDRFWIRSYEFCYLYQTNEPTQHDMNYARQFTTKIVDFYTQKYGTPMTAEKDNITNDYKWILSNGSVIKIELAYEMEWPIRLYLEFEQPTLD